MINYIMYFALIILLLIKKRNKKLFIGTISYLCLFSAFCYEKSDINGYRFLYEFPQESSDILYAKCIMLFKWLNLDFRIFMGMTLVLCIILQGYIIIKNTKNYNMVLALYMLSPFLVDNIQMRNFMAYTIITFAVLEFLWKQKKSIYFFIFAFIAFNFHTLACFYLCYLLIHKLNGYKKVYIIVFIGTFFVPAFIEFAKLNLSSVAWKLNIYTKNMGFHFDERIALICLSIIVQIYIFNRVTVRSISGCFTNKECQLFSLTYKINIVNILVIALIIYVNVNFFRISRNILIINYITFIIFYQKRKDKKLFILLIFSSMAQGLLYQVSAYKSLFLNNDFLEIFSR